MIRKYSCRAEACKRKLDQYSPIEIHQCQRSNYNRLNFFSFSKYFCTRLATWRGVLRPPIACEIRCHRNFCPSGISSKSCSSKFCSDVDHACLYVSGLGFVLPLRVFGALNSGRSSSDVGDGDLRVTFSLFRGMQLSPSSFFSL